MLEDAKYRLLEQKIELLRKKDKDTEGRKVYDEVFDHRTLLTIYKLICNNIIDTLDYPVSTGKEGNVFKGTDKNGNLVAVKIYRISNATFNAISKYIVGDPRFKNVKKSRAELIYAWAMKEYSNMGRMHSAGVSVPKPIKCLKNVLVMEYIGNERMPAPLMKYVTLKEPKKMFHKIIKMIKISYRKAAIVHSDLSEYNILIWNGKPVIVDLGQGVTTKHPNALEFLKRDVYNIVRYFGRLGVSSDATEIYNGIVG